MWSNVHWKKEIVRGYSVPVEANSLCACQVRYGPASTGIYFVTQEGKYGRIRFKGLNAIRISEGDHNPYYDHAKEDEHCWVFTIENSNWLTDRYHYEKHFHKEFYKDAKTLHDKFEIVNHFYFWFHDQFVEAIAEDIVVDESDEPYSES